MARVTPQPFCFDRQSALLRLPCLHEQHRRLLEDVVGDVGIVSRRLLVMIDPSQPLPKLVRTAKEHRGDTVTVRASTPGRRRRLDLVRASTLKRAQRSLQPRPAELPGSGSGPEFPVTELHPTWRLDAEDGAAYLHLRLDAVTQRRRERRGRSPAMVLQKIPPETRAPLLDGRRSPSRT